MDTLMDLSELVLEDKKKEKTELDLYRQILKSCHNMIRLKNKIGYKQIIYDIPPLLWGKPKYDIDILRNYLVDHLIENGFYVVVRDRHTIYICWDEKFLDLDKFYRNKSRIEDDYQQTMVPSAFPTNVDRNTMEFRQQKQRELQLEREKRFAFQKNRFNKINNSF
jgi:hypothetical protein